MGPGRRLPSPACGRAPTRRRAREAGRRAHPGRPPLDPPLRRRAHHAWVADIERGARSRAGGHRAAGAARAPVRRAGPAQRRPADARLHPLDPRPLLRAPRAPAASRAAHGGRRRWHSSHLGGHRFAPTMAVLPAGLWLGRVPARRGAGVLGRCATAASRCPTCAAAPACPRRPGRRARHPPRRGPGPARRRDDARARRRGRGRRRGRPATGSSPCATSRPSTSARCRAARRPRPRTPAAGSSTLFGERPRDEQLGLVRPARAAVRVPRNRARARQRPTVGRRNGTTSRPPTARVWMRERNSQPASGSKRSIVSDGAAARAA